VKWGGRGKRRDKGGGLLKWEKKKKDWGRRNRASATERFSSWTLGSGPETDEKKSDEQKSVCDAVKPRGRSDT